MSEIDKDTLIARQALQIANLNERLSMAHECMRKIHEVCYGIGGPLNDNLLGYAGKQLVPFFKITALAMGERDCTALETEAATGARVVTVMDHDLLRESEAISLLREINETMIYRGRGSTHWEGCEEQHAECAMGKRIEEVLSRAAPPKEGAQ